MEAPLSQKKVQIFCPVIAPLIAMLQKLFTSSSLEQVSQGNGCPIPGSVQGQVGLGLEQPGLVEVSLPMAVGLEINGVKGPFQPKPFHDSMRSFFSPISQEKLAEIKILCLLSRTPTTVDSHMKKRRFFASITGQTSLCSFCSPQIICHSTGILL